MRKNATSFVSEHSVELSIAPFLKSILDVEFDFVVPIAPWLTREFGLRSVERHQGAEFFILALFPRRPKLSIENELFLTVNNELKMFKKFGNENGITVIAGCPLARDFWELSSCKEYIWIDIEHKALNDYLVPIGKKDESLPFQLDISSIISNIKNGKKLNIESFENLVRDSRFLYPINLFGGYYKPIYFLIR